MTTISSEGLSPNVRIRMVEHATNMESSADGWRGRIGVEFTPQRALKIVRALLELHEAENNQAPSRILVGFDSRYQSDEVAQLIAATTKARPAGHDVTLIRHLPTPTMSFLVSRDYDLAILVTASHNPANWNGIKVKVAPGISAPPELVKRVDMRVAEIVNSATSGALQKIPVYTADAFLNIHAQAAADASHTQRRKAFRVAIDGLGGIAEPALAEVGKMLGWHILLSHRPVDAALCNHSPDPSRQGALESLCARVLSESADFGLALDGDGDRIFAVTDTGDVVPTHDLMALLVLHEHRSGKPVRRIAVTQSSGVSVRRAADEIGAETVETPIGFKYISKLLNDKSVDAGVGAVGDMAFRSRTSDRDPLFIAAHLSLLLNQTGQSLSTEINQIRVRLGTTGLSWTEHHYPDASVNKAGDLKVILDNIAPIVSIAPTQPETLLGGAVRIRDTSAAWLMLRSSTTEGGLRLYGELLNASDERHEALRNAIKHELKSMKQRSLV